MNQTPKASLQPNTTAAALPEGSEVALLDAARRYLTATDAAAFAAPPGDAFRHSPVLMRFSSAARPRLTRLLTVPTAQPHTSAASS